MVVMVKCQVACLRPQVEDILEFNAAHNVIGLALICFLLPQDP